MTYRSLTIALGCIIAIGSVPIALADVAPEQVGCDSTLPPKEFRACIFDAKRGVMSKVHHRLTEKGTNLYSECDRSKGKDAFRECIVKQKIERRNRTKEVVEEQVRVVPRASERAYTAPRSERAIDQSRLFRQKRSINIKSAEKDKDQRKCAMKDDQAEKRACLEEILKERREE